MASSIFSSTEKDELAEIIANVHETFKQNVFVFIEESSSVGINTDYNPLYGRYKDQAKAVTDKVLTKYTIEARVMYSKNGEEERLDIGLPSTENVIRLKVDNAGKEKLKNASFVEVDGDKYSVISDPESIGPFSERYYKVYLKLDS